MLSILKVHRVLVVYLVSSVMKNQFPNPNTNDNENILSGWFSLNISRKTLVTLVGSISLFCSGFYSGTAFAQRQNQPSAIPSVPIEADMPKPVHCLKAVDGSISNCVEM